MGERFVAVHQFIQYHGTDRMRFSRVGFQDSELKLTKCYYLANLRDKSMNSFPT